MSQDLAALLVEAVSRRATPEMRDWFLEAIAAVGASDSRSGSGVRTRIMVSVAGAGRRLRGVAGGLEADEVRSLQDAGLVGHEAWTLARCARVALIVRGIEAIPAGEHAAFVDELFRTGDNAEREALLGCLCVLSRPDRFLHTAVEACRTNVEDVFAAIACENRYPELHFPEPAFNQMVLKAIFIGLPVRRIVGLARRANPDLARMATDYASERAAAGRAVPDDVDVVTSLIR